MYEKNCVNLQPKTESIKGMKRAIIIVLLMGAVAAHGQHIHLFGNESRSAMYFNLDRLWSYNLYEHSTWGGGLHFVTFAPFTFANRREYNIYVNYSTHIHQWKYGLGVAYRLRRSRNNGTLYLSGAHDYYTAGSRSLDDASRCDLGSLSSFMTQRMMEQYDFMAGYSVEVLGATLSFDGRWYKGWRLFDAESMRYRTDSTEVPREDGREYRLRLEAPIGLTVQLQGGFAGVKNEKLGVRSYLRLIGQYYHTFESGFFGLDLYLQGGVASNGAPYTHLFDLGGSYGGPVCFNSSLLTATPNEFTARQYAIGSLRLHPAKPIFKLYSRLLHIGTMPMPYVGVAAMWGELGNQDEEGQAVVDGIQLQAPHKGILEPSLGIDDILRWGSVGWGVAVAYRLAPRGTAYCHEELSDNVGLMITAKLVL